MTPNEAVQVGRDLLYTGVILVAPVVCASLIVGLLISIFQTVTSIQEQTLTFAPRIIAVALTIVVTLPWTLRVLVSFAQRMLWHLSQVTA